MLALFNVVTCNLYFIQKKGIKKESSAITQGSLNVSEHAQPLKWHFSFKLTESASEVAFFIQSYLVNVWNFKIITVLRLSLFMYKKSLWQTKSIETQLLVTTYSSTPCSTSNHSWPMWLQLNLVSLETIKCFIQCL